MVGEAFDLLGVEDAEFGFFFGDFHFFGLFGREVVVVFELGEGLFAAEAPG